MKGMLITLLGVSLAASGLLFGGDEPEFSCTMPSKDVLKEVIGKVDPYVCEKLAETLADRELHPLGLSHAVKIALSEFNDKVGDKAKLGAGEMHLLKGKLVREILNVSVCRSNEVPTSREKVIEYLVKNKLINEQKIA